MPIRSEMDLLQNRRAFADLIKGRLDPSIFETGTNDRLKMVFDLEMHLAFLAEALRYKSPKLFTEYAVWTHHLLVTTVGDCNQFADCLRAIAAELTDSGCGAWTDLAVEYLAMASQQLNSSLPLTTSYFTDDNRHRQLAEDFLKTCLELRRSEALSMVLGAVQRGIPVIDIYLDVITPVMHELGRLWHVNLITVGHEHYCTAVTQMLMAELFPTIFDDSSKVGRLVSTCVAGELHEIGARMVSDLFEMHGWDTIFLGADVPAESVIDTLIRHDANILAISSTMACNLGDVATLIQAVRANPACGGVKIMVGGAAFNVDSTVWQKLGADGWAPEAQTALTLASRWRV